MSAPSRHRLGTYSFLLLSLLLLATDARAQRDSTEYVHLPINISLFPGASIGDLVSDASGKKVINHLAYSIFAGKAARLQGVEFAGLASIYEERTRGVQFAGLANIVGGRVRGAQFAGLGNIAGGESRAAQFAGLMNITGADAQGPQFAGALNIVGGAHRGAQFSGGINITAEEMTGFQAAGGINIVGGAFRGAQFAGGVNIVAETMDGLQAAPVNIAPEARGVQIGVINIADEHTGVPIGAVSYVRSYGLRYDVWADATGMLSAGIRSGRRTISNHAGIGVRPFGEEVYWGPFLGLGYEFDLGAEAFGAIDLISYALFRGDLESDVLQLSRVRLSAGLPVAPHLTVMGGVTFNQLVYDAADGAPGLAPWTLFDYTSGGTCFRYWPGATIGLRIH